MGQGRLVGIDYWIWDMAFGFWVDTHGGSVMEKIKYTERLILLYE